MPLLEKLTANVVESRFENFGQISVKNGKGWIIEGGLFDKRSQCPFEPTIGTVSREALRPVLFIRI